MTDLKPCPECGSDNLGIMTEYTSGNRVIHCMDCHKYYDKLELTREDTRSDIFEKWNEYAQNYKPEPKTEPTLKPCPFCGKEPTTIKNCNGVIIGLRCWSCSLDMVDEDYVTKWNRRVSE